MPYFDFFNTQEDENKKAPQQGGLNSFFTPKSTNNTIGGAPNVRPQTPAAAPSGVAGDSGSSFVNFERYVNANQGVSDANAGQMAGQVGGAADKAKTALGSMVDTFNTGVTAGTGAGITGDLAQAFNTAHRTGEPVANVPPVTNSANFSKGGGTSASMNSQPAAASPLKPAAAPQGAVDPKGSGNVDPGTPAAPTVPFRDALVQGSQQKYTGPQSLAQQPGYDALTGQVGAAAGDVAALQSKDGLSAWLGKNRNATAGYASDGSGARELDSLLLGRSGGKAFGELGSKYQGLGESVGAANTASIEKARGAEDATKKYAGEYGDLLKTFDAEEAAKADKGPSTLDEFRKTFEQETAQVTEDNKTNVWMAKIAADAGFQVPKSEDYAKWAQLQAAITAARGEAGWAEWLNAFRDSQGRKDRRAAHDARVADFYKKHPQQGDTTFGGGPGGWVMQQLYKVTKPGQDAMFAAEEERKKGAK